MIERLRRALAALRAGAGRTDLEARLSDLVEEARETEVRDRVLREVTRSRSREVEECVDELSLVKALADRLAHAEAHDPTPGMIPLVRGTVGADRACLMRRETGAPEAVRVAEDGRIADDDGIDRAVDGLATEWVIEQAEPLIVSDLAADMRFRDPAGGGRTGSLIALPLAWGGGTASAALVLRSRAGGFFHGRHARVLRIAGALLACALAKGEVRGRLATLTRERDEDVAAGTAEADRKAEDLHRRNEMITELYLSLEEAREQLEHRNDEVLHALAFSDSIVENVNVGIGVIGPDGTVLTWNRAMEQISAGQLTRDELVGHDVRELPDALREDFGLGEDLIEALELGRFRTRTSREVTLPEGRSVHLNANHLPVSGLGDGAGHVMVVLEDVTANMALHAQQVKAERLAAITETMVSVNHEVNNPLAVVLGRTQMLRLRLSKNPRDEVVLARLDGDLARIESEAVRIQEITAKLAALIEPVVTEYPAASGDIRMIDLERSR